MSTAPTNKRFARLQQICYAGFLLCMCSMPTSAAGLSIGTVVMILPAFASMPLGEQLKRFWGDKPAFFLSLILLLHTISILWTTDTEGWLGQMRIKLPLFFGLYSLAVMGPFSLKWIRIGLLLFLGATFVTGSATVVDYIIHKEQIEMQIQVSKPVHLVFDINHIYYSILLAFSIFAGIWLRTFKQPIWHKSERWVITILVLAHILIIHILTARTGLLAFYVAALVLGIWYLAKQKKYLLAILLVAGIVSLPVVGYFTVSSLKLRIDNTYTDLDQYFRGYDPNYLSIGTRFESWKTAAHLWQEAPVLGVGMADLQSEMWLQYFEDGSALCEENYVLPHNQFIQNLAGLGLLGFLVFAFAWVYPVLRRPREKAWLFYALWLIVGFGMMGESMMERQLGLMLLVTMWMATRWIPVQEMGRVSGEVGKDGL